MNRRKQTSSLGFPTLILLGITVVILSGSGITYVVLKNKEISARAEIERVQKRMDEHQVVITISQSEIDRTLGVFELPERLAARHSRLRKIESTERLLEEGDPPVAEPLNPATFAQR